MGKPGIITLITDFGLRDANVAAMKGVILSLNPQVTIVDLSHEVSSQNIAEGAYILWRGYAYFPKGTIHVAVVDPGVGSERRAIAVAVLGFYFVAPDNGVLTYVLSEAKRRGELDSIVYLNKPQFWLPRVSNTFHGRDVFAPVAAHLSQGMALEEMGERISDPVLLPLAVVKKELGRILGHVLHIDHFGNLLTNIEEVDILSLGPGVRVRVSGTEISRLVRTFAAGKPGEVIAYIDSSWHLAVAQVQGNASQSLGAKVGDAVEVLRVG